MHYGVRPFESCYVSLVDLNLHWTHEFYYRTLENISLETYDFLTKLHLKFSATYDTRYVFF
jgi:hypothetical protein